MSLWRRAAKVDMSQSAIVTLLRQAHVRVYVIRQPCDLLCQFYCERHGIWCWQPLECKTLGQTRPRADRAKQTEFLTLTNTPVVVNFQEAWDVLNTRHHLGIPPNDSRPSPAEAILALPPEPPET